MWILVGRGHENDLVSSILFFSLSYYLDSVMFICHSSHHYFGGCMIERLIEGAKYIQFMRENYEILHKDRNWISLKELE